MQCKFCGRESKNKNSNVQHEIRCKFNKTITKKKASYGMLGKKGGNQYTKAKRLGLPKPEMTIETRKKLSIATKKQVWNEERRKKLSESMKKAVEKYPESYTSSNRGRTKQIIYDDIKFQGKWELEFYIFCKENNIDIIRNTKSFDYYWNGYRKYFPDFFLPDLNIYAEVKGYQIDRDLAKWNAFPNKLIIVKKEDINKIRKGQFILNI